MLPQAALDQGLGIANGYRWFWTILPDDGAMLDHIRNVGTHGARSENEVATLKTISDDMKPQVKFMFEYLIPYVAMLRNIITTPFPHDTVEASEANRRELALPNEASTQQRLAQLREEQRVVPSPVMPVPAVAQALAEQAPAIQAPAAPAPDVQGKTFGTLHTLHQRAEGAAPSDEPAPAPQVPAAQVPDVPELVP